MTNSNVIRDREEELGKLCYKVLSINVEQYTVI